LNITNKVVNYEKMVKNKTKKPQTMDF